jgi:hypothetical protein
MKTEFKRTRRLARRAFFAVLFVALGGLALTRAADDPKPNSALATPSPFGQDYGTEYARQSSVLDQLKAMDQQNHSLFIQVLSVTTADPILNALLEQELGQETRLAGLKASGPESPEMKGAAAMIDDLKIKIDLRATGIIAGMSLQAAALKVAGNNGVHRSAGKVYIVGPVHLPGPVEIPGDEVLTVTKAILRAGGFGDDADKHNVRITRKPATPGGKDQVFTVNVADVLEKGKISSDLPLEPGDMIFVPQRLVHF